MTRLTIILLAFELLANFTYSQESIRIRDLGLSPGVLSPGKLNAITDVPGVKVGHYTKIQGDSIRTGVTAILPHGGNVFQEKVPAAIYLANAFGKLAGYTQVEELGNIETPIVLTNTLSVPIAIQALMRYTLHQEGNEEVRSVNAVVGETNDGFLNHIRSFSIDESDVFEAIANALPGTVAEGNVGAGTGTRCFGFKGGIGTASRLLPTTLGGYTVGVLVQTNFGGVLTIDGIPVGEMLGQYPFHTQLNEDTDGSCMMVVATNAPLTSRNLKRLAKRAFIGLGRTGGIASNGSGDYVIAFSTDASLRIPYIPNEPTMSGAEIHNDQMTALFLAAIEATEEAILNSLTAAKDMTGYQGRSVKSLPLDSLQKWIEHR